MGTQYGGSPSNVVVPGTVAIASSTNATPIVVQTAAPHGLTTTDQVQISGHQTNDAANGRWPVVVVDATHVQLAGTVGNGVGAATGTLQSLAPGATFQIPSDGDAVKAASVNVAFETSGDRTAQLAANVGPYKLISLFGQQTDDNATENTGNLFGLGPFTFSAQNTWQTCCQLFAAPQGVLMPGDIVEADFSFTFDWADAATTLLGFMLGLGAGFSVAGSLPGTFPKVAGSGLQVPNSSANTGRTSIRLQGRVTVPSGKQTCEFGLLAYCRSASFNQVAFTSRGDFAFLGKVWRPTDYVNRVA